MPVQRLHGFEKPQGQVVRAGTCDNRPRTSPLPSSAQSMARGDRSFAAYGSR
jgi:hypothetical protein